MSTTLRIFLVIVSLLVAFYTVRKIRKAQLNIDDSIFWISVSLMLVIVSIFPSIAVFLSGLLGIESPVNFVFLFVIFLVLAKLFFVSIELSVQKHRLNLLIETLAVKKKEEDDAIRERENSFVGR